MNNHGAEIGSDSLKKIIKNRKAHNFWLIFYAPGGRGKNKSEAEGFSCCFL
jgi:hypothetical protein